MATDDELREMERHLRQQYQRAGKEVLETAEKYFKKFESLDKQKQKQVEEGKLTEEEYQTWRKNKILYGEHWDRLLSQITGELYKTNQTAAAYVEGKSVKIFAENFNLVEKEIPDVPVKGYTFELVNEETVRQLATTNQILLPPPNPPDKYKDNKWNAKQVNAEVLQGILQGDSMDKIADRLMNVTDRNYTAAIRNARTMVTASENSGRKAGLDKAEADGIIFKKEWIATVGDGRTRESHLEINGELVDNGELFSNGCEFPGDWRAEPCEVYNCRCTLATKFVGFKKKKLEEAVKAQEERKQEPEKKEERKSEDKAYQRLLNAMKVNNVEHREVKAHAHTLTEPEIIQTLSGGDRTKGSCASVGLAYIGQKMGLDVLDFRDGISRQVFARSMNLVEISKMEGVTAIQETGKSSLTVGNRLLSHVEEGKEYYLSVGRHASIVRKSDGKLQYLELQSATDSGWTDFNGNPKYTLNKRFGCTNRSDPVSEMLDFMIDINESDFGDDFKDILGYLNTAESKQRKGTNGTIR